LPPDEAAAYFELAQYPVEASANLYGMYLSVARNHDLAKTGAYFTNEMADNVDAQFLRDRELSDEYNHLLSGKWNHMMDQTHIGYTGWQQPDEQTPPKVARVVLEKKPPASVGRLGSFFGTVVKDCDGISRCQENDGYISIEAEHFNRKADGADVHWQVIADLGRTLSSVIAYPQVAAPSDGRSMRLEYDIATSHDADAVLNLYLAPTLDTAGKGGLRLAVSIDDRPPQVLSFNLDPERKGAWDKAVSDNIVVLKAPFAGLKAGPHTLKVFRIDGNVVLEKLVLDTGGLKPSYLGPPESLAR
jgi:hypothetical protein